MVRITLWKRKGKGKAGSQQLQLKERAKERLPVPTQTEPSPAERALNFKSHYVKILQCSLYSNSYINFPVIPNKKKRSIPFKKIKARRETMFH